MLPYNTDLKPLEMPQYGRIIQQMIEYCLQIPYREERNVCATAIAAFMKNMLMANGAEEVSDKKVWDQLNMMAGFKLDVDFPVNVVTQEEANPKPEPIPYKSNHPLLRQYGRNIPQMLDLAVNMEDGPERETLIYLIANHMKKMLLVNNPESATHQRVAADIASLSKGKIQINPEEFPFNEYINIEPAPTSKKKKKHK